MSDELSQSPDAAGADRSWEERNPDIEREITIDEFQPKGTLTLTLIYFAIVVLMWIFMYFVEFAGNAPSIID
ncbi:hypothetical protein LQ318_08590 [Aliifodinibius salicampi]|uniref:Cytochrome c oxidase subunit IIa family protein n=1 Tax=Fodinibius salicampi TaxID=1920655 RepID=A0ABT3PYP6_9BACT|nr:hypothetical protein [Fodinibius salicampi]MCW9712961.1 hypothetical protein [Fodinibius salicampi]